MPAFNEQKLLPETLRRLRLGLAAAGIAASRYEIIVCDNASSDATAGLARRAGARVVFEAHRQIGRARNTGARAARGRHLLFVDADTWPSAALLARAWSLLESGRAGGGGAIIATRGLPLAARALIGAWNIVSRLAGLACGAFLFCRAEAFRAVGGFDESLYAGEEVDLSWRLRRHLRERGEAFQIITAHPLETSMRKLSLYSAREHARMVSRALLNPLEALRDPRYLGAWYDGRR